MVVGHTHGAFNGAAQLLLVMVVLSPDAFGPLVLGVAVLLHCAEHVYVRADQRPRTAEVVAGCAM